MTDENINAIFASCSHFLRILFSVVDQYFIFFPPQPTFVQSLTFIIIDTPVIMIFVGGAPFSSHSNSASSSSQADEDLIGLLEHPLLVSASNSFKAIPERKVSLLDDSSMARTRAKHVFVFQREYATVHPAVVEFVGTDEATTCVALVIRDRKTGITSIAHLDSPDVVDSGLNQMLSSLIDHNLGAEIDVHLVGAFEDASPKQNNDTSGSESDSESDDHSFPLCSKIIEALKKSQENFHIQTLCVLGHNTKREHGGTAYPVFNGLLVETRSGSVKPASFDNSSRCPDELVRRIRVTVSSEDPNWKGRLIETYDTQNDLFQIAPCTWTYRWKYIALSLQQLSDEDILQNCSTSPSAEAPDFVDNERRIFQFLIENPDWRQTFRMKKPRVFRRTIDGGWIRDVE